MSKITLPRLGENKIVKKIASGLKISNSTVIQNAKYFTTHYLKKTLPPLETTLLVRSKEEVVKIDLIRLTPYNSQRCV